MAVLFGRDKYRPIADRHSFIVKTILKYLEAEIEEIR